ncbi:hypothetical protein RvY_13192-2 [Ramazzottius varieornatus]|nr:hypothetical protein RvY_13192-2 [Ramazzottius varieornatus]
MGKVRKLRRKFQCLKSKEQADPSNDQIGNGEMGAPQDPTSLIDQLFTPEVLMAAPKITSQLMKQQLADYEERNTIATTLSAKSSTYAQMKKKTKNDLKHQLWQRKFETTQQLRKEEKDRTKREKTAVVGDVQPMMNALTDLSSFLDDVRTEQKKKQEANINSAKAKPMKKQKARAAEELWNIEMMKAVVKDPYYQSNPFSAISTHLKLLYSADNSTSIP